MPPSSLVSFIHRAYRSIPYKNRQNLYLANFPKRIFPSQAGKTVFIKVPLISNFAESNQENLFWEVVRHFNSTFKNKFAKLSKARRDHWSLIIEDHKSLMKVGPPKKIKVEKVQSQEISKLRNFYVGKSLSPESCS